MTPTPHTNLGAQRLTASALVAVLGAAALAPAAFGASGTLTASAAASKPKCKTGQVLKKKKKRVRVTKKVRVKGKMRSKKVFVTKTVWVCVKAPVVPTAPVAPRDTVAPSVPTAVAAAAGNGQVTLVWSPATDNVGVKGYRVFRDGALVASPGVTQHTDAGLANGRAYAYAIAAVDAAGNQSATAAVVATPKPGRDTVPPTAPPSLAASPGDRQVTLTWGASSDAVGVVSYELRRDGTPIAFQEGRTFTDVSLANGTTYTYTVLALDAAGNVSPMSTITATPADTVAPSVPAGLTATPGDAQVSLSWSAATDEVGVTGYRVYRDDVLVASPTVPYLVHTGLANGTTYAYTVVAVDAAANASAATAPASATPAAVDPGDVAAPSTPTNLAGTPGTGQVSLTWTASTDNTGVTAYRVYRGGTLVGSPAGPSFVDTGLVNGTSYSYTVTAIDAAGNTSVATAPVSVTPLDTQAPTIPGTITLTKNAAQHSITVSWIASTDNIGVLKYRVYRNGTLIAQPTLPTYTDPDLANEQTYAYTVAAVDAAGNVSAQAPAVSTYVS